MCRRPNESNINLVSDVVGCHLLGVDDLKPLLHLAALVAPALLVGHQRDVGMLGDALFAVAAIHAAAVLLVTQVVIAAQQRGDSVPVKRDYKLNEPETLYKQGKTRRVTKGFHINSFQRVK